MIDLVLQATTQAIIWTSLQSRGIALQDAVTLTWSTVPGYDLCWWAGSGKFLTSIIPPTVLPGFVAILRVTLSNDTTPNPVDGEQWSRSQVANFIKTNGSLTSLGAIPCYQMANGLRLFRGPDVFAWCVTNSVPGHEWSGGNSL